MQYIQYIDEYRSPLGKILLAADESGLTGLWFEGQKYYAASLGAEHEWRALEVFAQTKRWLDRYFSGGRPGSLPPLHPAGTPFQIAVWESLSAIPYGRTATYGEIAERVAEKLGKSHTSARAVGSAVGRNRISILIPCHRVVGADGSLTGYAGGLERKWKLLKLEGVDLSEAGRHL